MSSDRTIGRTVKVKTYQALVELSPETSSYVKSSYGGMYAIAVIKSFVVIPVGSERVVAIVTGLDMAEEPQILPRDLVAFKQRKSQQPLFLRSGQKQNAIAQAMPCFRFGPAMIRK